MTAPSEDDHVDSGGLSGDRGRAAAAAPDEPLAREHWTLNQIPSCCVVVDEDWTITHANPRAEGLLRRRRVDLVGTRLWDVWPDVAGGWFHDACRRAMSERVEIVVEGYDPVLESWFRLHTRPWRQGLALFLRDVTTELEAGERRGRAQRAERISRQGRHVVALVEDALAHAESEARRTSVDSSTVDVSALLHGVVGAQLEHARYSGIPVIVDARPRVMLTTDEEMLRRIIRYVLDDAIKHGAGSSVSVRLVTDPESGVALAIEVRDEFREPRSAAHAGTDDQSIALDLGMTVAQSLCQLLGYHLLVETDDQGMSVRRIAMGDSPERASREHVDVATTLHAFLDASPLPIIAYSPDWTVRVWNSAAARLFGWTAAEIIGSRLPLVREEDEPAFRALLRRALQAAEDVTNVPAKRARRDGGTIDVQVSIAPLRTPDGRLQGFISIVADVTERNHLEGELRQAQKMEVVGRLAAGVAHDFNNLLTVISANSQFLLADLTDGYAHQDVVAIMDATARAADLTRQLLLFARKAVPQRRVVDLNQQLVSVERMLRRTMGGDVTLVTTLSDEPALVLADPAQLELMAMNLALNARDAMPNGGTLTIATSFVRGNGADASHVLLEVSDTGVGMDAGTRDRVFEPFFTTKEEGKGTGLGLATVRAIVTDAEGTIAIDTELGKGTTFRVRLPLAGATP